MKGMMITMQSINEEDTIVLNKDMDIVLDNGRCILKRVQPYEKDIFVLSMIHGIIFSMFDGKKSYKSICEDLSYILKIPLDDIKKQLNSFLNTFQLFIEINSSYQRSDLDTVSIIKKTKVVDCETIKKTISKELKRKPVSLVYFITQKCSSDCIYCAIGSSYRKNNSCDNNLLTLDEIKKLSKQAKELGFKEVDLTGGEPLIHPDILKIIEIFSDEGLSINVSTKVPITETFINKIKEIDSFNLQISLDTVDPELYTKMIRVPNERLTQIISSLKMLSEKNIKYKVKATITSYNICHIPNMAEYLYEIGCKCFHIQSYYRSQEKHNDNLFPTKKEYRKLDEEMRKIKYRCKGMDFILGYDIEAINGSKSYRSMTRPYCLGGRKGMTIYENGDFGICGMTSNPLMRMGNIRNMTLKEVWKSNKIMTMLHPKRVLFKGTLCEKCDLFDECAEKRCYLRSLINFGTIYEIDPLCPYSKYDYKYTRF